MVLGRLGDGTTTLSSSNPVQVVRPIAKPAGAGWWGRLRGSFTYTMYLKGDGTGLGSVAPMLLANWGMETTTEIDQLRSRRWTDSGNSLSGAVGISACSDSHGVFEVGRHGLGSRVAMVYGRLGDGTTTDRIRATPRAGGGRDRAIR